MTETTASTETDDAPESRRSHLIELLIVILLGIVSIATAYATFQSSLYDGNQASNYSVGGKAQTEAESLYLEANQQYMQDAQTLARLTELRIQADAGDAVAAESLETLYFMSVSEDFGAAIERADAENAADPDYYTSPLDDEDYQHSLFSGWAEKNDEAAAAIAAGDEANGHGDRQTLAATLMAITLFLLGVAAVVRRERTKLLLIGIGVVVFVGSLVLSATVPFVWL